METVLKAFAELLKPYLKPEPKPLDFYKDAANLGNSTEELLDKHNDSLKGFEVTLMESYWTIEKFMLVIENLKGIEATLIQALNVAEGIDVEAYMKQHPDREDVKEVTKLRAKIQQKTAGLAEEMDTCFQKEAFVATIRRRIKLATEQGVDLRTFKFETTGQIRGAEEVKA